MSESGGVVRGTTGGRGWEVRDSTTTKAPVAGSTSGEGEGFLPEAYPGPTHVGGSGESSPRRTESSRTSGVENGGVSCPHLSTPRVTTQG